MNNIIPDQPNIDREYSSKTVSSWGGMRVMKEIVEEAGIREMLWDCRFLLPDQTEVMIR